MARKFRCLEVAKDHYELAEKDFGRAEYRPQLAVILKKGADAGSLKYKELLIKDASRLRILATPYEVTDERGAKQVIDMLNSSYPKIVEKRHKPVDKVGRFVYMLL